MTDGVSSSETRSYDARVRIGIKKVYNAWTYDASIEAEQHGPDVDLEELDIRLRGLTVVALNRGEAAVRQAEDREAKAGAE